MNSIKGGLEMYYKEDWEQAKERLKAFWKGEIIDRCCIGVFAPRKTSKLPPFPELQNGPWTGGLEKFSDDDVESINRWWTDPEENYNRSITWFENTYFGGEAIPATYINWGASAGAAFYGSSPAFNKRSVWYPEVINDWDKWKWRFNERTDKYWNGILNIVKYFLEQNNGRYFVGNPEIGNAADLLSLMRGMDKMSMDLIDYPEKINEAIKFMSDKWILLHEEIYRMTLSANDGGGVLPWMSLWAPGRHDQIACDFSSVISPSMFKEFFVPEIKKMGNWTDYATYHLDGPSCMNNHLDTLLGIEQLKNIEWTPGVGSPPTYSPQYIPKYKKIQASGKNLYLLAKINEIEPLLSELSPKRLYICTQADSEDEANELLRKVGKWSLINK